MLLKRLKNAWKAFSEHLTEQDLKRKRDLLDAEVEKRKKQASQRGASSLLIGLYEHGSECGPWVKNWTVNVGSKDSHHAFAAAFELNGQPYTLTLEYWESYYYSPKNDEHGGNLTLVDSQDRVLYKSKISRKYDYSEMGGAWWYASEKFYDVEAYIPGTWLSDIETVFEKKKQREKEIVHRSKYSRDAINDLKDKFGL